ncbi:MAG: phospho-sugar mutase [Clostridia bacterium]|nr:phospho-sugar mutase [Clostridia bacterium]
MNSIEQTYQRWLREADASLQSELRGMDENAKEDAFYRSLAFGTGGLRGVIGAGTNRMNIHTVAKASQGLADYVIRHFPADRRRIAVSYDSRILSDTFAQTAAGVFAGNGIQAMIYPQLMPTPCLSYAVRALGCAAGVMVTASHNPAKYNGYKVYGADGCQITTQAAQEILAEIDKLDMFTGIKRTDFDAGLQSGAIAYIPDQVYTGFVEEVKKQSLLGGEEIDKNVAIVYSPLNGTGLKPVLRTLRESGYTNVAVVKEQEQPDGRFPTCPYPNPEIRQAMELGLQYADRLNADLLLATDPDCDRCGIAVKNIRGEYELLTGNETGLLLLDYICSRRLALGTMPENPVLVKTIVTTDMGEAIADHYGVETRNVLTGFKFIGETIGRLEAEGNPERYIFGFEESYGYLSGTYVRDKDAVNAAFLICEMFAWHRQRGVSLLQKLNQLYAEYGYCLNTLHSFTFEGAAGFEKMQAIMRSFRGGLSEIGGRAVEKCLDYAPGLDGLPPSDVLKFYLSGGASAVVRPSGTEPKLKIYISVSASDRDAAAREEKKLAGALAGLMGQED